jgi:hypothetical protein
LPISHPPSVDSQNSRAKGRGGSVLLVARSGPSGTVDAC